MSKYITDAPDWNVIKTYFTQTDIQHMLAETNGALNLGDCSSVRANAARIYSMVSQGSMPPGNPWPAEKINNFYAWWKSGSKCPPTGVKPKDVSPPRARSARG